MDSLFYNIRKAYGENYKFEIERTEGVTIPKSFVGHHIVSASLVKSTTDSPWRIPYLAYDIWKKEYDL